MIKNKLTIPLILIFFISLIYFFSRLQNLTAIPVFGDEAIYLRWSQVMKSVETLRFLPLTDGKQPLFMWLVIPMFKIFSDPLYAGRFLSVLAGFGNMVGIGAIVYLITKGNLKSILVAEILYLFLPFTFFFDRLALADNLLSFFGIWSLFLTLLLMQKPRLDVSLILGATLGFAWITKSPAIYFIFLSFASFLFVNYRRIKTIIFPILSALIAFCIYNVLRLGPQFHMIAIRNRDYILSFSELIKHPLDPFRPHLFDIIHIYTQFISLPILILGVLAIVYFALKSKTPTKNPINFILISWWLLPLLANAAISKTFTARYILYTLPPLIIIFSLYLSRFKHTFLLLAIFLIPNFFWIYKISTDPFHFQLPSTET
ncbi:MAG: glycosyltransferase family 39 protein, partial [Patescibacteria group bacterium]